MKRPNVFQKMWVPLLKCVKHLKALLLTIQDNHFLEFLYEIKIEIN